LKISPDQVERAVKAMTDLEGRVSSEVARAVAAEAALIRAQMDQQAAENDRRLSALASCVDAIPAAIKDACTAVSESASKQLRAAVAALRSEAKDRAAQAAKDYESAIMSLRAEIEASRRQSETSAGTALEELRSEVEAKFRRLESMIADTSEQMRAEIAESQRETDQFTRSEVSHLRSEIDWSAEMIRSARAAISESQAAALQAEAAIKAEIAAVAGDALDNLKVIADRLDKIEQAPAAPEVHVASLADMIAGQTHGLVPASVAAQYIAREINAAIARAKG